MKPLTTLAAAGTLAVSALPGSARAEAPCLPAKDVSPAAVFDLAKAHFLRGDYEEFYQIATPYVSDREERKDALIGPLRGLMPGGFQSCWTIVQKAEGPGLFQDVSFFDTGKGPLGLYLLATLFDGEVRIVHFAYSDTPADMLELLK